MGARLVKDINPAGSSSPNELISFDGLLFFSAELGQATTASDAGEDENSTSTDDDETTPATNDTGGGEDNTSTNDGETTAEATNIQVGLMRSDGTENGTTALRLFDSITSLVEAGNQLYFIAGINDQYQLWTSDGTKRGTSQVKDLYPNADPSFPQDLFEIDGVLFYAANNTSSEGGFPSENGYELWRREGNSIGTPMFKNLIPDKIITEATITTEKDEETGEITTTTELKTTEVQNDSFPRDFTAVNGNLFFVAATPYFMEGKDAQKDFLNVDDRDIVGGFELWFSDGTESGTRPISINTNLYEYYAPIDVKYDGIPSNLFSQDYGFTTNSSSSFPRELTPSKDKLYFVANDGVRGFELWSVTDQGQNPQIVSDLREGNISSSPENLTIAGDNLYFSANNGSGRKLFYFNESLDAPKIVENAGNNPKALTEIKNTLYFSARSELGRELYSAEGQNAELISDINPGPESSSPDNITLVNRKDSRGKNTDYLYFTANDGSHGIEVMSMKIKDGQRLSIKSDADIIKGPPSSFPDELINHNQQLFFTAKNSSKGRELWTVGPAIKGPTGESGASSSNINIFENKTFVYSFKTDDNENKATTWKINSGNDASFFKIHSRNGRLAFKSRQAYENPMDHNEDNIYEVFVRSLDNDSGYKSDQLINVNVMKKKTSDSEGDSISDEILYYTADCGPMTASGPLYPCNPSGSSSGSSGTDSDSIPKVPGNSELNKKGKNNYNNYNGIIDDYIRFDEECDFADNARFWALQQIDEEDDALAAHYNKYFAPACDTSEIII
jgi:ELWxxDGT repeat protein